MTLEKNSIKSAMQSIRVPEDRLDQIIDQSVFADPIKKKWESKGYLKPVAAAVLVIGLGTTLMVTSPAGQQMISYLPFMDAGVTTGSGVEEKKRPEKALYPLDERINEEFVEIHFTEVTLSGSQVDIAYQQIVDPEMLTEEMFVEAELFAMDDRGNRYDVPYNGGTAYEGGTREDLHWTATLHDLSRFAKKVTFIPMATVSVATEGGDPSPRILEYDAIEVDLTDGSVQIVDSPGLPENVYQRW